MIDKEKDLIKLIENGLNIVDQDKFLEYLNIYSAEYILNEYSEIFINEENNKFFPFVDSNQIINLINFDKYVGSILLKNILFFESKLKRIIIENWIDFYNLKDTKIYNFAEDELLNYLPNINNCPDLQSEKFVYSLFEHAATSEFLIHYKRLANIPIEDLSLSWTFATTINFYRLLDVEIKKKILVSFNIPIVNVNHFDKMLNVFLKIRNLISHNGHIYNFTTRLYRVEFNRIYSSVKKNDSSEDKYISLDKVIVLLDYLLNWNNTYYEFNEQLKKVALNNHSKQYLIKIIYGLF